MLACVSEALFHFIFHVILLYFSLYFEGKKDSASDIENNK